MAFTDQNVSGLMNARGLATVVGLDTLAGSFGLSGTLTLVSQSMATLSNDLGLRWPNGSGLCCALRWGVLEEFGCSGAVS